MITTELLRRAVEKCLEPSITTDRVLADVRRHAPNLIHAGVFGPGESGKYAAGACAYCETLGPAIREYSGFLAVSPGLCVPMHEHEPAEHYCMECSGPSTEVGHDPVSWPCAEIKEIAHGLGVQL